MNKLHGCPEMFRAEAMQTSWHYCLWIASRPFLNSLETLRFISRPYNPSPIPVSGKYSVFNELELKKTQWPESASELYPPSDRRMSTKLVPTFADTGWHVVSVTDPCGRILGFLDRSRYFIFQVAPQLYSRGWVGLVLDPLLLRKCSSAGNRTRASGSLGRNSDHYTTEAIWTGINQIQMKLHSAWIWVMLHDIINETGHHAVSLGQRYAKHKRHTLVSCEGYSSELLRNKVWTRGKARSKHKHFKENLKKFSSS
jgi:hypothetical protein